MPKVYSGPVTHKGVYKHPVPGSNAVLRHNMASIQLSDEYRTGGQKTTGNSIYVSSQGTDGATCGTSNDASCKSIGYATTRCTQVGVPCSVLIAYGQYNLPATITIPDQVSYVGGYVGGQPSSYQSTINAAPDGAPAFIANKVTSTLKNLIVVGTSAATSAVASVVMQVLNTNNVKLDTVDIHGGTGVDVVGHSAQGTAISGVAGNAYNASSNPSAGGANKCGSYAAGGEGGTGWNASPTCSGNGTLGCSFGGGYGGGKYRGNNGGAGQSTAGVGTWNPGYAFTWDNVGAATATGGGGGKGADATVAAVAGTNRVGNFDRSTGAWSSAISPSGESGKDGGGGGGAGAGQAMVTTHCKLFTHCSTDTHNGVGGGGGGSGGCGATGGVGGQMGGGTFGLVLIGSSLQVGNALKVVGAQGGTGGDAGAGVAGGTGGTGGAGCRSNCNSAAQSGAGGAGGAGGASGGGAGGNGGPSVGLVLVAGATYDKGPTNFYPGASGATGSGAAGAGTAPPGAKGQTGLAQATYVVQ